MAEQELPNGNGDAGLGQTASDAAAAFTETLNEADDFVRRQWQENPIGVAAVVGGVGLLLGLLLGRRR